MPCALETPCSDFRVVDQVGMRVVIACRNGHHFSFGVIPPLTPDAELDPEVWRWDCGHFRTLDNTKYDGHVNGCCKTCAQARTRRFGKGAKYRTWLARYLKTRRARALRRRAGRKYRKGKTYRARLARDLKDRRVIARRKATDLSYRKGPTYARRTKSAKYRARRRVWQARYRARKVT